MSGDLQYTESLYHSDKRNCVCFTCASWYSPWECFWGEVTAIIHGLESERWKDLYLPGGEWLTTIQYARIMRIRAQGFVWSQWNFNQHLSAAWVNWKTLGEEGELYAVGKNKWGMRRQLVFYFTCEVHIIFQIFFSLLQICKRNRTASETSGYPGGLSGELRWMA